MSGQEPRPASRVNVAWSQWMWVMERIEQLRGELEAAQQEIKILREPAPSPAPEAEVDPVCPECGKVGGALDACCRSCGLPDVNKRPAPEGKAGTAWQAQIIDRQHAEIARLRADVERLTRERDSILLEARCWAMEAKTQRRTVNEVGSALGGMADWGPIVEAVRSITAERDEALAREKRTREALEALRTHPVVDGMTCRIRDQSEEAGTESPIPLADAALARAKEAAEAAWQIAADRP